MKTETHVGNALLFANGVLVISLLTDVGGFWWWLWLGAGFAMAAARLLRNFVPGFWVYHVCNYGEHEVIRNEGFRAPTQEKHIVEKCKGTDGDVLTQGGADVVSFTLDRSQPVLRTRRDVRPGTPLVGFWLYVRIPVQVSRSHMIYFSPIGLHRHHGQIAEVVVPRDQIDYSTWSYTDPRTNYDRCVTALVWLSSWYEDIDQIKKAVILWKAIAADCKKIYVGIGRKIQATAAARKAR